MCVRIARHARGTLVWFSLHGGDRMPEPLRRHIEAGSIAIMREPGPDGGMLVIHHQGERIDLIPAAHIPVTLNGIADFNIANALAAAAMRSEERRVGKDCVSPCRSRWAP